MNMVLGNLHQSSGDLVKDKL